MIFNFQLKRNLNVYTKCTCNLPYGEKNSLIRYYVQSEGFEILISINLFFLFFLFSMLFYFFKYQIDKKHRIFYDMPA